MSDAERAAISTVKEVYFDVILQRRLADARRSTRAAIRFLRPGHPLSSVRPAHNSFRSASHSTFRSTFRSATRRLRGPSSAPSWSQLRELGDGISSTFPFHR